MPSVPKRVSPPTVKTLKKYGLTLVEWTKLLKEQGGVCAICLRVPACGALNVDHVHVRGFKKMTPVERRRHVRGLLCAHCNHRLVNKYLTVETVRKALVYLESYEARSDGRCL